MHENIKRPQLFFLEIGIETRIHSFEARIYREKMHENIRIHNLFLGDWNYIRIHSFKA